MQRLILIGGASRSGKSLLARLLLEEQGIPYCSLDNCMMGFQIAFPDCGIHSSQSAYDRSRTFWPWIRHMCQSILNSGEADYLVEGDVLLPIHLQLMMKNYPGRVSGCFLGYSNADRTSIYSRIRKYTGSNDWIQKLAFEQATNFVGEQIHFSQYLKNESNKRDLNYVDTGTDFMGAIREACSLLLPGTSNRIG